MHTRTHARTENRKQLYIHITCTSQQAAAARQQQLVAHEQELEAKKLEIHNLQLR